MKTTYIYLGIIAILMMNIFAIHNDRKLHEKYDKTSNIQIVI